MDRRPGDMQENNSIYLRSNCDRHSGESTNRGTTAPQLDAEPTLEKAVTQVRQNETVKN